MKTHLHFGHIKTPEEVKAVLTPEQRKKFNTMMPEMGSMGMMGGCGMGCEMGMMHDRGGRGMRHGCDMMDRPGPGAPPPAKKEEAAPSSTGHQH